MSTNAPLPFPSNPQLSAGPPPPRSTYGPQHSPRLHSPLATETTLHSQPSALGSVQSGMAPAQSPGSSVPASSRRPSILTTTHNRSSSFFSFLSSNKAQPNSSSAPATPTDAAQQGDPMSDPRRSTSTTHGKPRQPQQLITSNGTQRRSQTTAAAPAGAVPAQSPPLHAEIRSIVALTLAHAHKVYYSGPLVRRLERQPDGTKPQKDEGWTEVWAQLGGTTLSIWDMHQIEEASKQGKEVPPTYINTTDAFVSVLGSITVPGTANTPPKRYNNVLTLNTAGSNLLLFSCPQTSALMSWAAALRLASWEKSRLEEIYTAHLIRITLVDGKDAKSPLVRGQMEGWVRIRLAGQTNWRKLWMVVSRGSDRPSSPASHINRSAAPPKRRISNIFSRETHPFSQPVSDKPFIAFYASPKPKEKRKLVLSISDVTQAFAVYPERPELINRSTLMKLEGTIGEEEVAQQMRGKEGWLLIMPELEEGMGTAVEMLKWIVGLHDTFEIYGRPRAYSWDPRDSASLMFAYPVGEHRDLLFLDREVAESLDPREDRTSAIRSRLLHITADRMRGFSLAPTSDISTSYPPNGQPTAGQNGLAVANPSEQQLQTSLPHSQARPAAVNQLPPLREVSGSDMSAQGKPVADDPRTAGTAINESSTPAAAPVPPAKDVPGPSNLGTNRQDGPLPISRPDPKFIMDLTQIQNTTYATSSPDQKPGPSYVSPTPTVSDPMPGPSRERQPATDVNGPSSSPPPPPPLKIPARSLSEAGASSSSAAGHKPEPLTPLAQPSQTRGVSPGLDSPSNYGEASAAIAYMKHLDSELRDSMARNPSVRSEVAASTPSTYSHNEKTVIAEVPPPSMPTPRPLATNKWMNGAAVASPGSASETPTDTSLLTLGRKPSGARAPQPVKSPITTSALPRHVEHPEHDTVDTYQPQASTSAQQISSTGTRHSMEADADALAALSYLEQQDAPPGPQTSPPPPPLSTESNEKHAPAMTPRESSPTPSATSPQFKSSFAPSKQALERQARSQAQQEAQYAAVHKPGRANGKKKGKAKETKMWNDSSEEEDEEEEDEDADSDVERPATNKAGVTAPPPRRLPQPQIPQQSSYVPDAPPPLQVRQPRTLPQIPNSSRPVEEVRPLPRIASDDARVAYYDEPPQIRSQAEYPNPGAARQTVWSQVLEPGRTPGPPPEFSSQKRDPFVHLETPEQTLTKAFTPQGLLSAGLQDKQDRSAKRQEELARESGASLINVPNKPPPPQTGLLGAITAHERDRKREGGVGAALTEREREKRIAEARERKFDEQQRQQMEQMSQGGSMYGGAFPGYNPMMPHPMMMGMNPMMMGYMGYPGMMGSYNPQQAQHLYAAQQAAQAYQQAMMALSTSGSQLGAEGGGFSNTPPMGVGNGGTPVLTPMMTGNMGFDPRMSMMGMPMMPPPMNPMLGMPMGMQTPLTPMMTGQDPRFSMVPPMDGGLRPDMMINNQASAFGGTQSPTANPASGRASPAGPPPL